MSNCKALLMDLGTMFNTLDRFERLPASEHKTQLIRLISMEITASTRTDFQRIQISRAWRDGHTQSPHRSYLLTTKGTTDNGR